MNDADANATNRDEPSDGPTCCGTTDATTGESDGGATRWRPDGSGLDEALPPALQKALGRFVGRESVDSLGEWVSEVREQTGGGSMSLEALCHADEDTGHWGEMGGERYHFACFYDAVIMAALADEAVDVRTESPEGAVIEAQSVGGSDLSVTPDDAVFSFGISTTVATGDGGPTLQDGYEAVCPYVKAFPDRHAYEAWADTVDASTVAMPLEGATEIATALAA
jgi:hypothetical protein